jgi:hypothetical protein
MEGLVRQLTGRVILSGGTDVLFAISSSSDLRFASNLGQRQATPPVAFWRLFTSFCLGPTRRWLKPKLFVGRNVRTGNSYH